MAQFNYISATQDEVNTHVESASRAAISAAKKYHTERDNLEVVDKINRARLALKMKRLQKTLNAPE